MAHAVSDAVAAEPVLPVILCVDDEANILSSLRRLFRGRGYQILTATSGQAGLEILRAQPVDLVISDMRMPEMNGAQFLEAVRQNWPQTIRLLLTGYADIASILDAINRGEIHRYITKPWDDNDILLIVRHALERQRLEQDKQRLEALTARQNHDLKVLNASLEEKVRLRTAALHKAHDGLLKFNARLKSNFLVSIKVFSNLIEMRGGNLAGHSARVADLARRLAVQLGLDERERDDVFVAGMLHSIGKITLPDDLLQLPETAMTGAQLGLYRKHPLRSAQLLIPLDDLRGAAAMVRSYRERFDGSGYPDGLAKLAIPVGARILALASDYEGLQGGMLMQRRLRPDEARTAIVQGRGKRYDPVVTDAFIAVLDGAAAGRINAPKNAPLRAVAAVTAAALRPGAVLAHDLVTADGSLLLSADHVLDARLIRQIIDFESAQAGPLWVTIYQE
ncbi:MAG: response regulator [Herminiimonas sp.]|nr:response regulator [Herminiimonas sp.]